MILGIFAKTFPQVGAREVLGAVREAGYECTQFNLSCLGLPSMPDALEPNIAPSIAAASKETGISIASLSGTYNMIHPDKTVREQGLKRLKLLMQHCHPMGTRLITLCTGSRDPENMWSFHPDNASQESWQLLLQEMERAVLLAEHYDVDLGVEPEMTNVVSSAKKARELLDTLRSNHLKIILDPANLFEEGDTSLSRDRNSEAVSLLAEHLAMAHAKDRKQDGTFAAPGDGVVDFKHFLYLLEDADFSGPLVAHGFGAEKAPDVSRFLCNALDNSHG